MARLCESCGAVYDHDDANYCNVCGSEALIPLVEVQPTPPQRRLREDPTSLVVATVLWISGVLYMVGDRQPRTWGPLLFLWGTLTIMGIAAGLVLRNLRTFAFFSAVGALFLILYGVVKL